MQHKRRSSDFGGFVSATPSSSTSPRQRQTSLQSDDLLGSFDDIEDERAANGTSSSSTHRAIPLPVNPHTSTSARPALIQLPPRPDEMPADYIPPLRSPRRMSQPYITSGLGSPPAISHMRALGTNNADAGPSKLASILSPTAASILSPAAKAANKWRRSTDRHVFDEKSSTADFEDWPTLVTHDNPFVPPEHPGVQLPPSGAPGFVNAPEPKIQHSSIPLAPAINLLGRRPGTSPVLNEPIAISVSTLPVEANVQLQRHLPARQRLSKSWSLIYQHGASLSSLYRQSESAASRAQGFGCVLIIEDADGRKFGAYLNENIVRREGSYYGSGESFLFKIPAPHSTQTVPAVYRWTGKNQYFSLCESQFVSFGGGSGTYGLIFDSTFSKCSSATCPTFDNEVLCSSTPLLSDKAIYFDCVGLEVWATMPL